MDICSAGLFLLGARVPLLCSALETQKNDPDQGWTCISNAF
jgi:hypothetical protein